MFTTTFKLLRVHHACTDRYAVLRNAYKRGDDEPITLVEIFYSNGLADALWALRAVPDEQAAERDKLARLYAYWCVRQVWHLLTDERSLLRRRRLRRLLRRLLRLLRRRRVAVETAERFALGEATWDELDAAYSAAASYYAASYAAATNATSAAAAASYAAACASSAAYSAAYSVAYSASSAAAAADAANAAYAAAKKAQAAKFREMFG